MPPFAYCPRPSTACTRSAEGPARRAPRGDRSTRSDARQGSALAALLPHFDADLDRRTGEAEVLAQPALDEAPVPGLQEAAREQDEPRRPHPRLGREQDLRLLPAA